MSIGRSNIPIAYSNIVMRTSKNKTKKSKDSSLYETENSVKNETVIKPKPKKKVKK